MATVFWSNFLDAQGRDSEEEAAFLGYLTTHGISPEHGELEGAYVAFQAFWAASRERASAEPGPSAAELAARVAVAALTPVVPKSRHAAPQVQKPMTAATRPPELRQEAEAPTPLSPAQERRAASEAAPTPDADEPGAQPGLRRR